MRKLYPSLVALAALLGPAASLTGQCQTGIGIGTNSPAPSAALDISSSARGLLIPRLTQLQRGAIAAPAPGLMVYQTDGTQPGFWYYIAPGGWTYLNPTGADNLGDHTAAQNLNLGTHKLTGGGSNGLSVTSAGTVTADNGLLVPAGGATITGGAVSINAGAGTGTTAIGTGAASGLISLGHSGGTTSINGSVGVGTANPSATLHVEGNARVTGLGNTSSTQLVQVDPGGTLTTGSLASASSLTTSPPVAMATAVAAPQFPLAIALKGATAYVTTHLGALRSYSLSNPASPTVLHTVSAGTNKQLPALAISGNVACVGDVTDRLLRLYDISDPAVAPVALGTVSTNSRLPQNLYASGTRVYAVSHSSGSLQTFDVSSPASPSLLATYAPGAFTPSAIVVNGTLAYLTNLNNSTLQIYDISDPAAPVLLGSALAGLTTGQSPHHLTVVGNVAYVVNRVGNTLQTFNVSNPAAPTLMATISTITQPVRITVSNGVAYIVSSSSHFLQTFDVSNPAMPKLLGSIAFTEASDVAVGGSVAYVTGNSRLQAFRQPSSGIVGQNADGSLVSVPFNTLADNLGNHTASQPVQLNGNWISNDGGAEGLRVDNNGNVGIGTATPGSTLAVSGTLAIPPLTGIAGGASTAPTLLSASNSSCLVLLPASTTANQYRMPSPNTCAGRFYVVRNNSGTTNAVLTVQSGALTPGASQGGSLSHTLPASGNGKTVIMFSDGVVWTVGQLN